MTTNYMDAQPFIAHVRRLSEVMRMLGIPVSKDVAQAIKESSHVDDSVAISRIMQALDTQCAAFVTLNAADSGDVIAAKRTPNLIENGWTPLLVKVINNVGATHPLRIHTSSARARYGVSKADSAKAWIDIRPVTTRPLETSLSGLPVQYVLYQAYAQGTGKRSCVIAFDIPTGKSALSHQQWNTEKTLRAWSGAHDVKTKPTAAGLECISLGEDPYIFTATELQAGAYRLFLRASVAKADTFQVFWSGSDTQHFSGDLQRAFSVAPSIKPTDHVVEFLTTTPLKALRLDLGAQVGNTTVIESIVVTCLESNMDWPKATFVFETRPSSTLKFDVKTQDGKPAVASFIIRDTSGQVYPLQSKRLAPDLYFQSQIYRKDGENVHLPVGDYQITSQRGPETPPVTTTLSVGKHGTTFNYHPIPWIEPAKHGWWSGDHHIHAAGCMHYTKPTEGVLPEDMARYIQGEGLNIGCNLTWGPCFDYQKQFFTGTNDRRSVPQHILRYDIEVSGFGSHESGHICLLNLKKQIPDGGTSKDHWPRLGLNTYRWAKLQGAITGPAHSANGLNQTSERLPYKDGPGGLPNHFIPAYNGIGAMETIVCVTHNVPGPNGTLLPAVDFISTMDTDRTAELNFWYHLLNVGMKTKISGETDFPCITGDRVGGGRVYVQLDGALTFEKWIRNLAAGRSYVSDGTRHLMNLKAGGVAVGQNGSVLSVPANQRVSVTVDAAAFDVNTPKNQVELIWNGFPVAEQAISCDGKLAALTFTLTPKESGWLAVRIFPQAHTNPIWIQVNNKPMTPKKGSVAWCLRGVDVCWEQKSKFYPPAEWDAARSAYAHARAYYTALLARSTSA